MTYVTVTPLQRRSLNIYNQSKDHGLSTSLFEESIDFEESIGFNPSRVKYVMEVTQVVHKRSRIFIQAVWWLLSAHLSTRDSLMVVSTASSCHTLFPTNNLNQPRVLSIKVSMYLL